MSSGGVDALPRLSCDSAACHLVSLVMLLFRFDLTAARRSPLALPRESADRTARAKKFTAGRSKLRTSTYNGPCRRGSGCRGTVYHSAPRSKLNKWSTSPDSQLFPPEESAPSSRRILVRVRCARCSLLFPSPKKYISEPQTLFSFFLAYD